MNNTVWFVELYFFFVRNKQRLSLSGIILVGVRNGWWGWRSHLMNFWVGVKKGFYFYV